jgi:hypothetical protein
MMHWPYSLLLVLLGCASFSAGVWLIANRQARAGTRKVPSRLVRGGLALLGGVTLTAIWLAGWYWFRPLPPSITETIFEGVIYKREARRSPRPVMIHVVSIDLNTPGLSFIVTPGKPEEKHPLMARTTSEFAREFKTQLALNGDFFSPWFSNKPWDYYPRSGDPVKVHGIAASRGTYYSEGERKWDAPTLYLSKDNHPSLQRPTNEIYNAISGNIFLVRDGQPGPIPVPEKNTLEPRSAVGFNREGTKLFLVAVDGRQPNYSEGMNYDELVQLFVEMGAHSAINLDGGGSTALVVETKPGHWSRLNCPAHTRIPGRERPIANHLGVYLERRAN